MKVQELDSHRLSPLVSPETGILPVRCLVHVMSGHEAVCEPGVVALG